MKLIPRRTLVGYTHRPADRQVNGYFLGEEGNKPQVHQSIAQEANQISPTQQRLRLHQDFISSKCQAESSPQLHNAHTRQSHMDSLELSRWVVDMRSRPTVCLMCLASSNYFTLGILSTESIIILGAWREKGGSARIIGFSNSNQ